MFFYSKKKLTITIESCIFKVVYLQNLSWNQQTSPLNQGNFLCKTEKVNLVLMFSIFKKMMLLNLSWKKKKFWVLDQICKKIGIFHLKIIVNAAVKLRTFYFILILKFKLNKKPRAFLSILSKKGIVWFKRETASIPIKLCIFKLAFLLRLSSNWQFCFLDQICQK